MKQNIFSIIVILAFLSGFVSCESFLEEIPRKQLSPSNAFNTLEDLELAAIGCYNALQAKTVSQGEALYKPTDIILSPYTAYLPFANNQYVRKRWSERYEGINTCNTFLDNVDNVETEDVDAKNELVSEVLWIRSFLYFGLVREFINIPMPLHATTDLEKVNLFQVPPDTVFAQIVQDLEFCLQHLDQQSEKDYGRVTKGAAQAFLSEVYLTMGSWEKRDDKGDGKACFQKCADLSKKIIDEQEYCLVPYFPDVFHYKNENNEEVIMAVKYTAGGIGEGTQFILRASLGGWSSNLGAGWSSYRSTMYYYTIYEESDSTRRDWSCVHIARRSDGTLYRLSHSRTYPAYYFGKYRIYPIYDGYNKYDADVDFILFRYGEVLLNYAEALNEVNNGPNEQVFWALNKIRERARNVNGDSEAFQDIWPREVRYESENVTDLEPTDYPDYQSIFDYLVLERARELGSEDRRWYDLTRWGILYKRMKWIATTDDGNDLPRTLPEEGYFPMSMESMKNECFAIPPSEIQANPNLIQNSGY